MININPDQARMVIASLMLAERPLSLQEIADFAGLTPRDTRDCALYLKARGMLTAEHGGDPKRSLVWNVKPQVLAYTEGLRAIPAALTYQRSKRIAANKIRHGAGAQTAANLNKIT